MTQMADRLETLIEDAFDADVQLVARAVTTKVTGGMALDAAAKHFGTALDDLFQIRRALLDIAADKANGVT